MKVATVFLFLLFSFNLFGASVELQLATLNNKVQALTNKISAMKAFSRKAGRYELEHNGSKVVLRDNGAIEIYSKSSITAHSLDHVVIHSEASATMSAREINASAFTVGNNITMKSRGNLNIDSKENIYIAVDKNFQVQSQEGQLRFKNKGGEFKMRANGEFKVNTDHDFHIISRQMRLYPENWIVKAERGSLEVAMELDVKGGSKINLRSTLLLLNGVPVPPSF